jgi:ferrous iron transport protein B
MAAIRKELSTGWMMFSIGWSTILAYAVAVFYYQMMFIMIHPIESLAWLLGIIISFSLIFIHMRKVGTIRHASGH